MPSEGQSLDGSGLGFARMGPIVEAQYDPAAMRLQFPGASYGQTAFQRMSSLRAGMTEPA